MDFRATVPYVCCQIFVFEELTIDGCIFLYLTLLDSWFLHICKQDCVEGYSRQHEFSQAGFTG